MDVVTHTYSEPTSKKPTPCPSQREGSLVTLLANLTVKSLMGFCRFKGFYGVCDCFEHTIDIADYLIISKA